MKRYSFENYGSPDVLELRDVTKPTLKDNEVLVKVESASINPAEWHLMRATNILVRVELGLFKPKQTTFRSDIAGVVEAVGKNATRFRPGDEVYGRAYSGGYAEYSPVEEEKLALKPTNLSFAEAAAVPLAALTGLQGLRKGQITAGQKVLVNGSSGGIGTFTVQLAKEFGTEVTAVCSTRNLELVRSLGADYVIDYTKEDMTKLGKQYDLIIDNVGNLSASQCKKLLTPTGNAIVIGFENMPHMLKLMAHGTWISKTSSRNVTVLMANVNHDDLLFLKDLIEAGKIVSVIDRQYPFAQFPEAMAYLGTKHARGKVIVNIGQSHKTYINETAGQLARSHA